MYTRLTILLIFIIFLGLGFSSIHFFEGNFNQRNPAAIRQYYDFTNLRGTALEVALKERVISNIEVVKSDQDIGLRLGHFAFTNTDDQKKLGCQEYTQLTLEFESDDAAVNGEKSKMEIIGECQASRDTTMIEPVMIPTLKLLSEKPSDGDIQFMDQKPVAIHLENMPDDWPKKWNLVGVKFSNSQNFNRKELNSKEKGFTSTAGLYINRLEVKQILGKPFVLSF